MEGVMTVKAWAVLVPFLVLSVAWGCGDDDDGTASDADTDTDTDADADADTDTDSDTDCVHPAVVESCSGGWCTVPAGCYTMGAPDTEPGYGSNEVQHQVTITRPFLMKETEVTQDEWVAVIGSNPSSFTACGGTCPVEQVSWYSAAAFCNALSLSEGLERCYEDPDDGTDYDAADATAYKTPDWPAGLDCAGYRLPTEAEWEYAARAGTTTAFHTGPVTVADPWTCDLDTNLDAAGWYCGNASSTTHPVAQKTANGWGLYDVHGNVWEWTWDWYGAYGGAVTDPVGPLTGATRVTRGGSWDFLAGRCRSASRDDSSPGIGYNYIGFRPSRSIP
jgi:formylglycine-generating enzyme required for sulfatase activity